MQLDAVRHGLYAAAPAGSEQAGRVRARGGGEDRRGPERLKRKRPAQAEIIQSESSVGKAEKFSRSGGNNSVGKAKKIQSPTSSKTTEFSDDDKDDEWRFEIKRKRRTAGRKNTGSTAKEDWYYWVVRIHPVRGIEYYGTLDILDRQDPERLKRYWRNSGKRKR